MRKKKRTRRAVSKRHIVRGYPAPTHEMVDHYADALKATGADGAAMDMRANTPSVAANRRAVWVWMARNKTRKGSMLTHLEIARACPGDWSRSAVYMALRAAVASNPSQR